MHTIEQHALALGVKIGKPQVSLEFFPIPFEKYIVIYSGSNESTIGYDYFEEVLFSIRQSLYKSKIGLVQIGDSSDRKIDGAFDARGIRKKQIQYTIKNSSLLISGNAFPVHFASGTETPSVIVLENNVEKISGAYWNNNLVSYVTPEKGESINKILPETISNVVCKKLGFDKSEYSTIFIGDEFTGLTADLVPNFELTTHNIEDNFAYIRIFIDEVPLSELNINNALFWCYNFPIIIKSRGNFDMRKFNVVQSMLGGCKKGALGISHEIDESFDRKSLDLIKALNIQIEFESKLPKKELKEMRLEFFEETIRESDKALELEGLPDKIYIKSKKAFIMDGRIHLTKWHGCGKMQSSPNEDGYHEIKSSDGIWDETQGLIIKTKNGN